VKKQFVSFLFLMLASTVARAVEPLHTLEFQDTATFRVLEGREVAIYPLSEPMREMTRRQYVRDVIAMDLSADVLLETEDPQHAILEIAGQIETSTGLKLGKTFNSRANDSGEREVRVLIGETSTWTLFLTEQSERTHRLTLSYVIEERAPRSKNGS
jgi:hypothetical protein